MSTYARWVTQQCKMGCLVLWVGGLLGAGLAGRGGGDDGGDGNETPNCGPGTTLVSLEDE